ncbi:unnamed protein product [Trypanosoma congolense IL3000]|uniref:WGS project CAEQ00000000 data, annotated contig 153 n=1 Tax=Trypanosoma congolense (strain IL3000) TaxID=1068625 RepID=F9W6V6_TRYCI|nr:unnamed protein product [Trypanosoma congolense IL3000]
MDRATGLQSPSPQVTSTQGAPVASEPSSSEGSGLVPSESSRFTGHAPPPTQMPPLQPVQQPDTICLLLQLQQQVNRINSQLQQHREESAKERAEFNGLAHAFMARLRDVQEQFTTFLAEHGAINRLGPRMAQGGGAAQQQVGKTVTNSEPGGKQSQREREDVDEAHGSPQDRAEPVDTSGGTLVETPGEMPVGTPRETLAPLRPLKKYPQIVPTADILAAASRFTGILLLLDTMPQEVVVWVVHTAFETEPHPAQGEGGMRGNYQRMINFFRQYQIAATRCDGGRLADDDIERGREVTTTYLEGLLHKINNGRVFDPLHFCGDFEMKIFESLTDIDRQVENLLKATDGKKRYAPPWSKPTRKDPDFYLGKGQIRLKRESSLDPGAGETVCCVCRKRRQRT